MAQRILIADDDKLILALINKMLKKLGGRYIVIKAFNGKQLIEKAKTDKPDLIITDLLMPEMTGTQALKELKKDKELKYIPVIIVTGTTEVKYIQESLNEGATDFLKKPVNQVELIARVKIALSFHEQFKKINSLEEKIKEQTVEVEKLSLIAKETDNSILLLSPEGKIEWVNERFSEIYEYTDKEFCEKYGNKMFAISETIKPKEVFPELKKTKQNGIYKYVIETKNGNFRWIKSKIVPILDKQRRIKKFMVIEIDITKEKYMEKELEESLICLSERLKEIDTIKEKQKEIIEKEKAKLEREKEIIENEKKEIEIEKQQTEKLLLNILPENVAIQLKSSGAAKPRNYRIATVLFTDFKGFTNSCENLSPQELVHALHSYFVRFDDIIEKHYIEKIKTIGDAYMCVGGVPIRNKSNPIDVVLAGLEIQDLMNNIQKIKGKTDIPIWQLRLGIHTGPVIAGVVGKRKFAYDIWGDTVNIASRMETSGEVGKVNISGETYRKVKDFFSCTYRGKIDAKNKGKIDMYFVNGLKKEFSHDENSVIPNSKFIEILSKI